MALLEDAFKGENLLTGVGVALGAVVLGPVILPLVRPLAKGIVKAGLVAYDQGREALAELNERTGDIVAEARAEMAEEAKRNGGQNAGQKAPAPPRRGRPATTSKSEPRAGEAASA